MSPKSRGPSPRDERRIGFPGSAAQTQWGYIGWQNFVISDNGNAPPDFLYEQLPAAMLLILAVCGEGRENRRVSDTSIDYAKILASK